jgi:luciferase family oxidoreductase group 1
MRRSGVLGPKVNSESWPVPLSVLDLAPVSAGATAGQALRATLDLARRADRLGFHRYWLAEHHNMPGIASSAPAVLIGQVAAATSRMRVGSGGVMLPNHPPLVVAEQFGMLEALYPGRIDLGLGRAPGTDQRTAAALRRSAAGLSPDDFPQQLGELVSYFRADPAAVGRGGLAAVPAAGNEPATWLLGSSLYSARLAGLLGLPFAFAHHFSAENTLPALHTYRSSFKPSGVLDQPYAMIAASVLCAEDDERARWLAGSAALSFLKLRQGKPVPLPSPAEAADYPYSDLEKLMVDQRLADQVIGGPKTVRRGIEELLVATQVDELMITAMTHDPADRVRSYELIANLWTNDRADNQANDQTAEPPITPAGR